MVIGDNNIRIFAVFIYQPNNFSAVCAAVHAHYETCLRAIDYKAFYKIGIYIISFLNPVRYMDIWFKTASLKKISCYMCAYYTISIVVTKNKYFFFIFMAFSSLFAAISAYGIKKGS